MDEKFQLPVEYNGKEHMLNTSLLVTGYTHKFIVEIEAQEIIYEPDEGGNYRAIIHYEDIGKNKALDPGLLKAIADVIESLVK